MRILVVDDDAIFADLLKTSLSDRGFENVVVADSARMALTEVEKAAAPFDCFLLDIIMEEMDGIELCSVLRKRSEYRATPIIMLTSSKATQHMTSAFEAGATDFLNKPLNVFDMIGRINAAMMLVEATKKEKRGRLALRAIIRYAKDFNLVDVKDRVSFKEIKGMCDYFQIENELLRLSPESRSLTLLSVRLKHFQSFILGREHGFVLQLLHEISTTISDAMACYDFRFCYVGYGVFVIVQHNSTVENNQDARKKLLGSLTETVSHLSFIWSNNIMVDVSLLSTNGACNRNEALRVMKSEFEAADQHDSFILPEILSIEDQLFEEIARLEKVYGST